jgi:hypothetical protein
LQKDKAYYILFRTIHEVLKVEKLLKNHGLDTEVVPVPRNLSSDCGVCIKSKASVEELIPLLGDMVDIKCFVFDGMEYKPGKHGKTK